MGSLSAAATRLLAHGVITRPTQDVDLFTDQEHGVEAAAGAVEAVATLLSVRDGIVPPTANLEKLGDDIELDVVAGSPREVGPKPAISNSFGFGGHNATLVLTPTG